MKMIRVTSKKDGHRRAGRAWTGTDTVPAADFDEKQVKELEADPWLVVDEIEVDDSKATPPAKTGKNKAGDTDPPK